jgi:hypothetical protein
MLSDPESNPQAVLLQTADSGFALDNHSSDLFPICNLQSESYNTKSP